ncbi:MAG: MFS transporter [Flavobacteriales bacterium]|nr:MFS transporter [Flavobacteriales bacterium]MBP9080650.1 MFS transporter [Flavobacteriales bacterium]
MEDKLWNRDFIISCLSYFLVACSFSLLMPTIPIFLSQELGVEPARIGVVLSSYVLALLLVRPFSGFVVDSYRRKPVLLFGTFMFVAIFAGYYYAATVLFFIVLRFIHGLFWGLSTVSANTVAIDIIPSARRAEGIGYFGVNANIAMAFAPYIGVKIYDGRGFHALITAALAMGVLAIVAAAFIRVPERPCIKEKAPLSLDRFILVKALPILFNQLFLAFGWGTLVAFAVLYGKEVGIPNAGIFFLFLAGGVVLSRIAAGKLVDRGHLHGMMAAAIILIGTGFTGFALFHDIRLFCFSAFLIGLGYGTLFPALQTIYISMAPSTQRGTANSTYLTGFDLGISIGMLLGASVADVYDFSTMYLFTGVLSFVALFIYWFWSRGVFEKQRLDKGAGSPGD